MNLAFGAEGPGKVFGKVCQLRPLFNSGRSCLKRVLLVDGYGVVICTGRYEGLDLWALGRIGGREAETREPRRLEARGTARVADLL